MAGTFRLFRRALCLLAPLTFILIYISHIKHSDKIGRSDRYGGKASIQGSSEARLLSLNETVKDEETRKATPTEKGLEASDQEPEGSNQRSDPEGFAHAHSSEPEGSLEETNNFRIETEMGKHQGPRDPWSFDGNTDFMGEGTYPLHKFTGVDFEIDSDGKFPYLVIELEKRMDKARAEMFDVIANLTGFTGVTNSTTPRIYRESDKSFWRDVYQLPWIRTFFVHIPTFYLPPFNATPLGNISVISWPRPDIYPIFVDSLYVCQKWKSLVADCGRGTKLGVTGKAVGRGNNDVSRWFERWSPVGLLVIPHGYADSNGYVRARGAVFIPAMCSHRPPPRSSLEKEVRAAPYYREVFVLSTYGGTNPLHWNMGVLPRLVPYVHFLVKHRDIRISVPHPLFPLMSTQIEMLGISASRVVTESVRGGLVYLPQGGECGEKSSPLLLPYIAQHQAKYLQDTTLDTEHANILLIIGRIHCKNLTSLSILENHLRGVGEKLGLQFQVFDCALYRTPKEMVLSFQKARLVVGTSGRALTGLSWMEGPGSVVELGCKNGPKAAPGMKFAALGRSLGLRYYFLLSKSYCHSHVLEFDMKKLLSVIDHIVKNDFPKYLPASS